MTIEVVGSGAIGPCIAPIVPDPAAEGIETRARFDLAGAVRA